MSRAKKLLIAGGTVTVLAGSGAAYAYWTSTGSGSSNTSTTTTTSAIVVNQTSAAATNMGPGVAAKALSGNFDNTTNSGPVYIASVTVAVGSITRSGTAVTGCDATDFTLVQPTAVNAEIPTGTAKGSWTGGSIAFNDKASTNQDACKGVTVQLNYTAS